MVQLLVDLQIFLNLVLQEILVTAPKLQEETIGTKGTLTLVIYIWILYIVPVNLQFQNNEAWCHEMSWHQRLQEVSLYQFI